MRVTKQGADGKRFGWTICRNEEQIVQSTRSFDTLTEALMDSARGAALLVFGESRDSLASKAGAELETESPPQLG